MLTGPLTLSLAIATALSHHPSLKASQAAVMRDQERTGQAQSILWPQVEASATYNRTTANYAVTPGSLPPGFIVSGNNETNDSTNNWTGTIGARQLLFDFGKTIGSIQAAEAVADVSKSEFIQLQASVIFETTQAYFTALQAQELLKVQEQTQSQHEQHLIQAKGFFQVGSRPKFDVLKAEVNLANNRVDLLKAQNAVKTAISRLQLSMGITESLSTSLDAGPLAPTPASYDLSTLTQQALAKRPELITAKAKIRAADAQRMAVGSGDFPTLTGTGGYSWRGQQAPLVWNWSVGVGLSWPLFTGFNVRAQIGEADANLIVAKANEETLRQSAVLEVEQNFADMQNAWERIQATDKVIEQALEQLDLAENRYKAGTGSLVEITDAQVSLTSAKTNRVQALADYRIAESKLLKSTGNLLALP